MDNSNNPFDVLSNLKFSKKEIEEDKKIEKEAIKQEETDLSYRKNQKIRIWLEKKKRNGKPVSVITGLNEDIDTLKDISATLKKKLGVGGSYTEDQIVIQERNRDRIIDILKEFGYKNIKKSGG